MREVEAKHLGIYIATFLLDMSAEHLTKCFVKQVSGSVVGSDGATCFAVDSCVECLGNVAWQLLAQVDG